MGVVPTGSAAAVVLAYVHDQADAMRTQAVVSSGTTGQCVAADGTKYGWVKYAP